MRIVFLVPGFPAYTDDTTCLPAVQQYIRALAAAFPAWDVHVFASQYPAEPADYMIGHIHVHAMGGHNKGRLHKLRIWRSALRHIGELHQAQPIDIIHSFWLGLHTLAGQRIARRNGIRHIASIGGQEVRFPGLHFKWIRWDELTLTAGSTFAAETFQQNDRPAVDAVIPLGLDVQRLDALPHPDERDVDLLGVGSLIPLKQYNLFLNVVAALRKHRPDLQVVLIGDGPMRQSLEAQIQHLGLADCVTLTGLLPRPEVMSWMFRSRVFMHTSEYESQGYVFLEALYAGLDVVSFDVGFRGDSDRVWSCASAGEMCDVVLNLLDQSRLHTPVLPYTVNQSVDAFTALYGAAASP